MLLRLTNADSTIMLMPKAQITCKIYIVKCVLNVQPTVTMKSSAMISQIPRVNRKKDSALRPFFIPYRQAAMPASSMNTGAQK